MVSIRKVKQNAGFQLRRKGRRRNSIDKERIGLMAAALCVGFLMTFLYTVIFLESSEKFASLRKTKKHPVLVETMEEESDAQAGNEKKPVLKRTKRMNNGMNAIALDIKETLKCETLIKEAVDSLKLFSMGGDISGETLDEGPITRRLQQDADNDEPDEKWGDLVDKEKGATPFDDVNDIILAEDWRERRYEDISAKHLFCIAASEEPPEVVTKEFSCDGANKKRKPLLQLWSAARSQMSLDLLMKVLNIARESKQDILGQSYNIWAPANDKGMPYMVNVLNSKENVGRGGFNGLEGALGPGKTFVDVGSCLGLTCLVVNNKYPGTKIVSIEPASPNWLLQELNLRCNLPKMEFKNMTIMLEGIGANNEEEDNMMSKVMWRHTVTTAARSWAHKDDYEVGDEELVVRLRSLKSILTEANVIAPAHVDVLNVDCQGCEYSMIPEMTEEEFEEIPIVTGRVHWGYIQPNKLPSSKRGGITHQRLCGHENIARTTMECCAFPDTLVKSTSPAKVLEKDGEKQLLRHQMTVSDIIADDLCKHFTEWTEEHLLYTVNDDFNWFELTSQA